MNSLIHQGTKDRPSVNFDRNTGELFIGGSSLPENVLEAYKPVLDWLNEYSQDPNPETRIDFFFEYLNTASSHMIMRIVKKCVDMAPKCSDFSISWFYSTGDVDIRDFGMELADLVHFPIKIIQKPGQHKI